MRAGFIGYRNFAGKLRGLFEQSGVEQFIFYHPDKVIEGLPCSNRLEDLFGCDFIVVASPDWTHGAYLRRLQDYDGYIFCGKMPVISREDLCFLRDNPNPLLYFDFNYRKSRLCGLLRESSDKILYVNQQYSNNLALTEKYRGSWRSDASKAPMGVFQLSGIHLFDLLVFCFGRPVFYHTVARNLSPYGDSIDNLAIHLEFQNKMVADLFYSYTTSFRFSIKIITTEGLMQFNDLALYDESLKDSVDYFLDVIRAGEQFSEASLEGNLLSTELLMDIKDGVRVL